MYIAKIKIKNNIPCRLSYGYGRINDYFSAGIIERLNKRTRYVVENRISFPTSFFYHFRITHRVWRSKVYRCSSRATYETIV